jgi:Mor family transcriptional regulator
MPMSQMHFDPTYPQLLADLAEGVRECILEHGVDERVAEDVARKAADRIGQRWGGIEVYIPVGLSFRNAQRNAEIWAKFNGNNVTALAREYRLTERQVTSILAEQRAIERRRRQGEMFGDEDSAEGGRE